MQTIKFLALYSKFKKWFIDTKTVINWFVILIYLALQKNVRNLILLRISIMQLIKNPMLFSKGKTDIMIYSEESNFI